MVLTTVHTPRFWGLVVLVGRLVLELKLRRKAVALTRLILLFLPPFLIS